MTKEDRSWGTPLDKVGDAQHLTYGCKSQIFI